MPPARVLRLGAQLLPRPDKGRTGESLESPDQLIDRGFICPAALDEAVAQGVRFELQDRGVLVDHVGRLGTQTGGDQAVGHRDELPTRAPEQLDRLGVASGREQQVHVLLRMSASA